VNVESHLLGAAFVLMQGVIIEAVSIMKRLAGLDPGPNWLPSKKAEILMFQATVHPVAGTSDIALIDAVANYVKHRHEWPCNWQGASAQQRVTISTLATIGLHPQAHNSNLHRALAELGARSDELLPVIERVITWRQRMAEHVRREWGIPSTHE
jgi:glutathione S-transferase